MRECNEPLLKVFSLVNAMNDLADEGDAVREDVGCGVLFGVLRDCAYKIGKMAEEERDTHIRKGWWPAEATCTDTAAVGLSGTASSGAIHGDTKTD